MPANPYPLQATEIKGLTRKLNIQLDELYENRIAGAILGDVFGVGDDDVLALTVGDGLQKTNNELSVKVRTGYGITAASTGLALKQQAHEAAAAAVSGVAGVGGADSIDLAALNTALSTLVSQINLIKTTVNNILVKLESAEIFKTS